MVASKISADMNGDTLAAFLPQIFGKVSQCTHELRMGELEQPEFHRGQCPMENFPRERDFLRRIWHAGKPLPTAQLAALAAELDRKAK